MNKWVGMGVINRRNIIPEQSILWENLKESKADATSCIEDIDKHERELQGSK